jgi:zinc transporter ZupT
MGLGLAFGVALHNYPIGIIIGLAFGGVIYLIRSRRGQ